MKKKSVPMVIMAIIMLISLFFAYQGINMQSKVSGEEQKFHALQESYFSQDKATKDSAATGSKLNKQLVEIQQYPSELLKLKLVGVGKIITGIYILLFGILIALMMVPIKLGKIIKEK